jgi:hypothetical protein
VLQNRGIVVETADFEFRSSDKSCKSFEKNYNPPLSWHLTPKQETEITNEWQRIKGCSEARRVGRFLDEMKN